MRRNTGRHADGNARRPIGQQIGKSGGQHNRLFIFAVISGAKINRVAVNILQQQTGNFGHARFRITHGGGIIAIDIAKIALPINQRIAHRKILRQTHQSIVNRLVTMRVITTDNITDNARRFFETLLGVKAQLPHGIQQATVHRLQPVAHIGQSAIGNG